MSKKLKELQAEIDGYVNAIIEAEKAIDALKARLQDARQEKHAEEMRIAQAKPLTTAQRELLEAIVQGRELKSWRRIGGYGVTYNLSGKKVSEVVIRALLSRRFLIVISAESDRWGSATLTITDAGRAKLEEMQ